MKIHELKIWPEFFNQVFLGNKTFEVRENDRDFKAGDRVVLREYDMSEGRYTGRQIRKEISYVLRGVQGSVIPEGYCVFSIRSGRRASKTAGRGRAKR